MVRSRTTTATVGLLCGLAVSVAAWVYFETILFFLFLPFVPFVFGWGRSNGTAERSRRRTTKRCPACSFRTTKASFEYCPQDGRRLHEESE
ncbi:hypothetical protein C496_17502 [Natronorubrum tibetense GA33]|uniref:Uncharacterized protein n=1 Tax=Natronorubrum tibetense GA33 TaxID=1114856 RepID=L9VN06_9EURY|nr:hypothetical protein C496_17502 [Natronorubrum tibetense GA33]